MPSKPQAIFRPIEVTLGRVAVRLRLLNVALSHNAVRCQVLLPFQGVFRLSQHGAGRA